LSNIQRFSKVELLVKNQKEFSPIPSTDIIKFDNCRLIIIGDYIVVETDENDKVNSTLITTRKIFNLNQIVSYKTHTLL
jgi:hypothetical protein